MKNDSIKKYLTLQESLRREKATLETRLAQIQEALAGSASSVAARGDMKTRRRARNEMSLKQAVSEATRKKALSKQEILDEIQRMGYRFTAKDPINSLNTVLYTNKQFKNLDGKFTPAR